MYYVYILKSEKDKKLYIGYTDNLKIRFGEHTRGEVESTKHRRPMTLFYYEAYYDKKLAQQRENKLKDFGSAYSGLIKRLNLI
ncbi:MAG: GIY-YIG nuclease family protein [Candidatus Moranbacteria bacterium]|nr:GIY-YIG nuclease family protein [Candidatus Moranbacteria bacterium]